MWKYLQIFNEHGSVIERGGQALKSSNTGTFTEQREIGTEVGKERSREAGNYRQTGLEKWDQGHIDMSLCLHFLFFLIALFFLYYCLYNFIIFIRSVFIYLFIFSLGPLYFHINFRTRKSIYKKMIC